MEELAGQAALLATVAMETSKGVWSEAMVTVGWVWIEAMLAMATGEGVWLANVVAMVTTEGLWPEPKGALLKPVAGSWVAEGAWP